MPKKKLVEQKEKETETVKVRFTLSIGFVGAEHDDEIEYDKDDVPDAQRERETWLHDEWKDWAWKYIDGCAEFVDGK